MTARAFCFAVMMATFLVPQLGYAELMYTYTGTSFAEVGNAAGGDSAFTTDDFVSGYVKFLTEPMPGVSFGIDDIEFLSLSAGPVSVDTDTGFILGINFDFGAGGNIVGWHVDVAKGSTEILTAPDLSNPLPNVNGFDWAVSGDASWGASGAMGSWQAVPEPSAISLWSAVGLIGLFVALGRRHRRT